MTAESLARKRAYDPADIETRLAMHQFIVTYFGGDYQRTAWFLNELLLRFEEE